MVEETIRRGEAWENRDSEIRDNKVLFPSSLSHASRRLQRLSHASLNPLSTMNNSLLTFNETYEKLKPQLAELDALRRKWRLEGALLLLIPIAGAVMIGIGFHFFEVEVEEETRKPDLLMLSLMFVGMTTFILGIIKRGKQVLKYKETYKDQLIGTLVQSIDPSFISRPRSFIEKIAFMRTNFFDEYNVGTYYGKNLIKGKRGSTDFRFCEVEVKKGGNDPLNKTFKGLFFEADFHKHFKGRTLLLPRKSDRLPKIFKPLRKFDGERVKFEDVQFEKNFNVYATDPVEARYILSLPLMEALNQLQNRFNCKIYASFLGDNMYLAINWKKKLFAEYWTKNADNEELIGQYYDDITLCLNLVDDLNLNTRIWSKRN